MTTIRLDDYVQALNTLRGELYDLHYTQGLSWRKIANLGRFRGIGPAMLWRIDQGYDPKGKTREKLGLPATRYRLAADVTAEQREALRELMEYCEADWTTFARALANYWYHKTDLQSTDYIAGFIRDVLEFGR